MNDNWVRKYLSLALHVASWSKDPSTKVGAVIIDDNNSIVGHGFNGFPKDFEDTDERLAERDVKLKHVIHAEVNAILNSKWSVRGCTLLVTHIPCISCIGLVHQAGIKKVYYIKEEKHFGKRWNAKETLLKAAEMGVEMESVERSNDS